MQDARIRDWNSHRNRRLTDIQTSFFEEQASVVSSLSTHMSVGQKIDTPMNSDTP